MRRTEILDESHSGTKQKIGQLIKLYRIKNKMTQKQLADKIGITFQQVQKYEKATNNVPTYLFPKIAMHLNCSTSELLAPVLEGMDHPSSELLGDTDFLLLKNFWKLDDAKKTLLLGISQSLASQI